MKFRIKDRARREFDFLLATPLDMIGHQVGVPIMSDPEGYTALQCWWARDTHGKVLPCRETEDLGKVLRSKQSVNLQILMWAEDVENGLLPVSELREYTEGWPEWVFRATVEQAGKRAVARHGFIPTFLKIP